MSTYFCYRTLAGRRRGSSTARRPMTGHGVPAVVALGQVGVVGVTYQSDVRHLVVAPQAERVPMVEFEPVALLTASTLIVHVAASVSVALTHGTPDRRRNVARVGNSACIFFCHLFRLCGTLAVCLRPREAPGFEPFELLGDGLLDDRRQVAVPPL